MASREEFLALLQQYASDEEEEEDADGREKQRRTTAEGCSKEKTKDHGIASPHSASDVVQKGDPLSMRTIPGSSTCTAASSSSSSSSLWEQPRAFPFAPSAWEGTPHGRKNVTRAPQKVGRSLLAAMHQQQVDHSAPSPSHIQNGNVVTHTAEACRAHPLSSSPPPSGTNSQMESGGAEATEKKTSDESGSRRVGGKRERNDGATPSSSSSSSSPSSSRHRLAFRTVETYKPLSSGGFFDSTHGSPDRARCMAIGAIVVLVGANASSSSSSPNSATPRTTTGTGGSGATADPPSHAAVEHIPSSSASPAPSSVLGDAMGKMKHFLPASALTDEEKTYGRFLDAALFDSLAEVTRCDVRGRALEVWCLSGKRQKLSMLAVRPAGFMESQLFQKWKADPSSRPVQHIGERRLRIQETPSHPVPLLPSTPQEEAKSQDGEASQAGGTEKETQRSLSSSSPPSAWWVLPHLLVRVVAKEAGVGWWGQKALVLLIDRKAERMRLVRWEAVCGASDARASPGVSGAAAAAGGGGGK